MLRLRKAHFGLFLLAGLACVTDSNPGARRL